MILALLFWAGSWYGQTKRVGHNETGKRTVLYYVDPMNPSHTSLEPGLAPCGMKMEPVYTNDEDQPAGLALASGSVKITPEKQQMVGVRVAKVEQTPWTYALRTLGKVAVDETRIYRLNAYTEGWIVRTYDNSTGSLVRKDEPLAAFYSKDLLTALQTFYYACTAVESLNQGRQSPSIQINAVEAQRLLAEGNLMNLGMGKLQIDELARTRQLTQEIVINAPATSFVLARNISPGQKFSGGEELYRLADLSQVWVLADIFENEAKYIRPGEEIKVKLPHRDEEYLATVSQVLPEFNQTTLTLKVRLELNNPKFTLRPGMFTDVEFPIHLPPSINIPVDAVMNSGLKQTVFVDRGHGFFEPRQVKTGWRLGDRVEIREGLKPGESIVISGNFLIDSESRMKLAAAGMFGEVSKDPERYIKQTAAGEGDPGATPMIQDPVCSLPVATETAKQAGRTSEYQGKTYYFDTEGCKQRFDNNPQRYLSGSSEATLPQKYLNVPTDPNSLLRLRRDFLRSIPTWKTQEQPQGQVQGAPQEPQDSCPDEQHGGAPALPQGSAHPKSPEPDSVQPLEPQAPPQLPQAQLPGDSHDKGQQQ